MTPRPRHRLDRHGDGGRSRRPFRLRRDARPTRRLPGDPLPRASAATGWSARRCRCPATGSARSASRTWPPARCVEAFDAAPRLADDRALILCLAEEDRPGTSRARPGRLAAPHRPRSSSLAARTATPQSSPTAGPPGIVALDQRPQAARRRGDGVLCDDRRRRQLSNRADHRRTTWPNAGSRPRKPQRLHPRRGRGGGAVSVRTGAGALDFGLGLAREQAFIYNADRTCPCAATA